MLHAKRNHAAYMIIIQGIEHRFSVPPELDQLAGFQQPQLVADGTLGDAHDLGNIVDADFVLLEIGGPWGKGL